MDTFDLTITSAADPPELIAETHVRTWSICTLLWGFACLLLSIYMLFYDSIDIYQHGISFKLMLDCFNLTAMLVVAIIAITVSEVKTVKATKCYFYGISIYAPINVILSLFFNDDAVLNSTWILFSTFMALNVLTCSLYIL